MIYFYGCENHEKCKSLQFSSGYTDAFTAEQANDWNKKYRWIKAYSGDGSNFKMDVSFIGGITKDNLEQQFELGFDDRRHQGLHQPKVTPARCRRSHLSSQRSGTIVSARLRAYIVAKDPFLL